VIPRAGKAADSLGGSVFARSKYVGLAVVMSAIVLLGFWPYYSGLTGGGTGTHWLIHLHALVFSAWMVLLLVQVVLAFRRQLGLHQRLGRAGIVMGLLVLGMGLVVSFAAPVQQVLTGRATPDEAAAFLILPLGDMLFFTGFFAAGIAQRRNPELHKRLMLLATMALLFAPAARAGSPYGLLGVLVLCFLPLVLAMAHDALMHRPVSKAYLLGAAVFTVSVSRIAVMDSEPWLVIGRRLLSPWLPLAESAP